ncbi:MAG: carboxymuconolactone decarboxylase family protein [Gammaproteobacteria bacterium]|nr:MAG: carboxymuconolactone decarboxylase family protein [Gammaproteobacteria bacterium]
MPLVPPLDATDPKLLQLSRFFETTLGFTPNSVLTMQRRPDIARAFIELNRAVMDNHGRVTSELKRLIGYMASLTAGCRYCQAHTGLAAVRFGLSEERLEALWEYRTNPLYSDAERAALDFALAAASVPNDVTEEISERLQAHWDEGEIVEILGVVSLFGFLNRWNDSMGTPIEDGALDFATEHLQTQGWNPGKHRDGGGA